MSRTILFSIIAACALIGVLAVGVGSPWRSSSQQQQQQQQETVCWGMDCAHFHMRMIVIESQIAQRVGPSYLAIGDSITELADLPDICGYRPINAGIAGATSETFEVNAKHLVDLGKPSFVVIGLGANDAMRNRIPEFKARMENLIASLRPIPMIAVPVPPAPAIKDVDKINRLIAELSVPHATPLASVHTLDGIHPSALSYPAWKATIADQALRTVCLHLGATDASVAPGLARLVGVAVNETTAR